MNMYTSSKVTHAKYAVAETCIPSVKRITVIPVLRNVWPLLTVYFCIEFQDRKLMLIHVWCQKTDEDRWQAIPYDVYFIDDDERQMIA